MDFEYARFIKITRLFFKNYLIIEDGNLPSFREMSAGEGRFSDYKVVNLY